MDFYNKQKNITNQQGFPQVLMTDLQKLPIKIGNIQQMDQIAKIVKRIISNEQEVIHDLDILVYQLYNLTQEEIELVESI